LCLSASDQCNSAHFNSQEPVFAVLIVTVLAIVANQA
jgi:hypothetical protein